jgi:hypothetical protein
MTYNLIPADKAENALFCRMEGEQAERHGFIGYMRADFGRSGGEFWNTWFDTQRHLKTYDFKNEFQEVIDSLRNDGDEPPFGSRSSLQKFLFDQKGLPLHNNANGFKIQTPDYTYAVYCSPSCGDYDVRVFTYDNRYLLPELTGQHELPFDCVSTLPSTGEVIYIMNGDRGYQTWARSSPDPAVNRQMVDEQNQKMGVTRAQEAAMLGGSINGWDTPAAKPWNYDANGVSRIPPKNKSEPERG